MLKKIGLSVVALCFAATAYAGGDAAATGTVNGVNSGKGTVNISHGPIKGMGMDAMTMDFLVDDPAMLDELKKGQTVDFSVSKNSKGMFVITDFEVTGTSTAKK